jgi:hypothetical protein
MEEILGELQVIDYVVPEEHEVHGKIKKPVLQRADFYRKLDKPYLPASLQDKADDVRRVYEFYDKLCDEEFKRIPKDFKKEWADKGGLPYYRSERRHLFRGGVLDVPDLLEDQIKPNLGFKFLGEVGVIGGGRQELNNALDGAKKWLESVPGIGQQLKRQAIASIHEKGEGKHRRRAIGGWSPRSIPGPVGPISMGPHHVGLAVDINYITNPHLKGASTKAIDAVLDHLASKGKFSGDQRLSKPFVDYSLIDREPDKAVEHAVGMWIKSMTISEAFKAFLKECHDKINKKQPLDPDPKKPDVQNLYDRCKKTLGKEKLNTYATKGIFDLELALVVALIKGGGMRYGGEFKHSKDEHHFEVRNWHRLFKPPKC